MKSLIEIENIADKILRNLNLERGFTSREIEFYIKDYLNYEIIYFNCDSGNMRICEIEQEFKINISEKLENRILSVYEIPKPIGTHGAYDIKKFVFVNYDVIEKEPIGNGVFFGYHIDTSDLKCILLRAIGHIVLGHLEESMKAENYYLMELEADVLAYCLMEKTIHGTNVLAI